VRVRVDIPELLPELCEFLEGRGCLAVRRSEDEIEVVVPDAPSGFQAATMLLADLAVWRAEKPWAQATLNPGPEPAGS
jgi:hypothetical protein